MAFLDQKERVIDLKLTSYGRYLLAIGKLNPVFYAFFDDDILYDSQYAGFSEGQTNTEGRIQEDTPRLAAQASFTGKDLEIFTTNPNIIHDLIIGSDFEDEEKIEQGLVKVQAQAERTERFQQPIGTSNPRTQNLPAWNATFFKAPLSSSANYLSSSSDTPDLQIPQLNTNLNYQIVRNAPGTTPSLTEDVLDMASFDGNPGDAPSETSLDFPDGGQINLNQDYVVLKLEESNTFFEKDNFEIEAYEVLTVSGKEKLIPLKFYKSMDEVFEAMEDGEYDPHSVEQYFEFQTDADINPEIICPYIKKDKTKNFYQTKIFSCEDAVGAIDESDIYLDPDDTEDICE